jgi:hypothetical protein
MCETFHKREKVLSGHHLQKNISINEEMAMRFCSLKHRFRDFRTWNTFLWHLIDQNEAFLFLLQT